MQTTQSTAELGDVNPLSLLARLTSREVTRGRLVGQVNPVCPQMIGWDVL